MTDQADSTLAFDSDTALRQWLTAQARTHWLDPGHMPPYLLAHADDGVIWGRFERDGSLSLAGGVFNALAVTLRVATLQQARLFGPAGELWLWRAESNFRLRLTMDGATPPDPTRCQEETQWLWGQGDDTRDGFTLMREGQQGLLHAPPLRISRGQRAALKVRHYIDYDDQGQAYIAFSRLVDLVRV